MILLTKARPVRIRIMSDGIEHSSYDSLMLHFSVDDLLASARDGRLSNWLRQQGEETIADKITALQDILNTTELNNDLYIQFICCFFPTLDVNHISCNADLYQWWTKTKYANCPECKKIELLVEAERVKAKKESDERKMREDYQFARDYYAHNPNAYSNEEWKVVFECHSNTQQNNADYWWIMYRFTKNDGYLDRAASLGNKAAIEKKELMKDRFYGINKKKFKAALNNSNSIDTLLRDCIPSIKTDNNYEKQLKDELLYLCDFWIKIAESRSLFGTFMYAFLEENKHTPSKMSIYDLQEQKMLRDESLFVRMLLHHRYGETGAAIRTYRKITGDYVPAKLLSAIINKKSFFNYYLVSDGDKLEINSNFFHHNEIFIFVIKHIFDTFSYEKI